MVIPQHSAFCLTIIIFLAGLTLAGCSESQKVVQPTQEILDAEASYMDDYAKEQQAGYEE
jgi:hypothetical protein